MSKKTVTGLRTITGTDSPKIQEGDKILRIYNGSSGYTLADVKRKDCAPKVVPPTGHWEKVFGRPDNTWDGPERVRITAPDGSAVFEFDTLNSRDRTGNARSRLAGNLGPRSAYDQGWTVEKWVTC